MYITELRIVNFRAFGDGNDALVLPLRPGLTALVGENEAGKTAVIDALRVALGTSDQEWFRIDESDFHGVKPSAEIRIHCRFAGLSSADKRAFPEYLTHSLEPGGEPELNVHWIAKDTGQQRKGRPYRRVEVRSGADGSGPIIPSEVRDLLRATYLRPLRDAEQAMSAGRGSRLSQVLFHSGQVRGTGVDFDPDNPASPEDLNVLGIGDFANSLLMRQQGVVDAKDAIDGHLKKLTLVGEDISTGIGVSGSTASEEVRLRYLLEKLDLELGGTGRLGLGSNNLLFIACELLLLSQEEEGNRLLLIEEPEAHLDTQRQLQLVKSIQDQAVEQGVQVVMTTHSPNLASSVSLDNMVMIRAGRAFSLKQGCTRLEDSDYRFLQRFLDATKANLFFARGVLIVEGDAENILIPTIAEIIGADFAKHGVSIVNVGGVGLRRYARIFQRVDEPGGEVQRMCIPVACITDMDVMPDCGEKYTGKTLPTRSSLGPAGLDAHRLALEEKADGQCVRTFVSDNWTLEYDLALARLAEDVWVAARLAKQDRALADQEYAELSASAEEEFRQVVVRAVEAVAGGDTEGCGEDEVVACETYALFTKGSRVSKPVAAQYLAERLRRRIANNELTAAQLRERLPSYIVGAIEYVTAGPLPVAVAPGVADEDA
ncbi:MAG: ATP-dependent nuclease [Thermoleophilia bacterium]